MSATPNQLGAMMTQEQQKLMHAAADECMSPDQRDLFDLLGKCDSDVFARLFRCVIKRVPASPAQSEEPIYQIRTNSGNWLDRSADVYSQLLSEGYEGRIVYTAPQSTQPAKAGEAKASRIDSGAAMKVAERFGLPLNQNTLDFAQAIVKRADELRPHAESAVVLDDERAKVGEATEDPCYLCRGHVDVHRADGEYLGECPICSQQSVERSANEPVAIVERQGYQICNTLNWSVDFYKLPIGTKLYAEQPVQAGNAVAWRVEHRPGRYMFVEHEENLKLHAGANIVPLFRAFHSVDSNLNSVLDRLESMVTWEPRLLAGADAIDRLEHVNRLLYELLNPHPESAVVLDDERAAFDKFWRDHEGMDPDDDMGAEETASAAFSAGIAFARAVSPQAAATMTNEQRQAILHQCRLYLDDETGKYNAKSVLTRIFSIAAEQATATQPAQTRALTVTPAMVKAAMPWLTSLHHMRKTDKESYVEEAIKAALTAAQPASGGDHE